jgi:DNA-binding NarL/FixJ family response regulator
VAIRVLLYTKDPVLMAGLKALFQDSPQFELAGVANDAADARLKAVATRADVLLLDMQSALPINSIADLRRSLPSYPMVLWVQSIGIELAHQVVHLGVQGILRRDLSVEILMRCLEKVAQGELWYERALSDMLLRSREVRLSPRQQQLLQLISQGLSNKQVGATLMITEGTVKVYLSKLFKKLGVLDRFELALYGLKHLQYGDASEAGMGLGYCPSSLIVQERLHKE